MHTEPDFDQRLSIAFDYPVYFTRRLFAPSNALFARAVGRLGENRRHRVIFYVDSGVAEAHPHLLQRIQDYCQAHSEQLNLLEPPTVVPGGEAVKEDWELIQAIVRTAAAHHLCRHSYIVAIGGGAVLDAVGFGAALIHRGLRHIRVPTTVLSQNDGGVGVKNAMNAQGMKNFVGAFAPPFAIFDDFDFLRTLRLRDWIAGISEAFKVAIIEDADFFDFLCEQAGALAKRGEGQMETLIRRCAVLHLDHIRSHGDPFESGSARPLDFGHWAAHKLESLSRYQLRHGEAVAIGIGLDSFYAL
ncbi:MAG: 3-dehydroquinate synthase, partial [Verrucomicrobiota bacterium]